MKARRIWIIALITLGCAGSLVGQEGGKTIVREGAGADRPELIIEPEGFTREVLALAFSPDSRLLAAGGNDKVVRLWQVRSGQLVATLRGYSGPGGDGAINALAFSPDGRLLIVGVNGPADEGNLRAYDTAALDRIAALLPGHPAGGVMPGGLAFSADGKFLASAGRDRKITLWDWPARRPVAAAGGFQGRLLGLGFPWPAPVAVAFDETTYRAWSAVDGRDLFAIAPADAEALLAEAGPGHDLRSFIAAMEELNDALGRAAWPEGGQPGAVHILPDAGLMLASGITRQQGADRYWAGIWNRGEPAPRCLFTGFVYLPKEVTLSPDRRLMAGSDQLGNVFVWDAATGSEVRRFPAAGRSLYSVGISADGHQVAFGWTPYRGGAFTYNHYAPLERAFDLTRRSLLTRPEGAFAGAMAARDGRAVELGFDPATSIFSLSYRGPGGAASRYTYPARYQPMCYALLGSTAPGFADPIVAGLFNGALECKEPRTMLTRQSFVGHGSVVTAVAESPDGRFLVSSSADRTVRVWSLERFEVLGVPDIEYPGSAILNYVVPGGEAARAGVRVGDKLIDLDGRDLAALTDLLLAHRWPWKPGERVTATLERAGRRYQVPLTLVPGGGYTEPLLSLYAPSDDQWVIWTPQGYYDCAPGGDRLIGWRVNRGRAQEAAYYPVHQFRERFFKPEVIDRVLQTGDVEAAVRQALAGRRGEVPEDPRAGLARLEPPRVRIVAPTAGTRTTTAQIRVRAEARAPAGARVAHLSVLLNGRPVEAAKDIAREQPELEPVATLDQELTLTPGPNEITVLAASDAQIHSVPVGLTVQYEPAAAPAVKHPDLYVLAVGISRYAKASIRALEFADRDARDFAAAWEKQQGDPYGQVHTRLLTDDQATTIAIKDGLLWLQANASADDRAVLFLSSHGTLDERGNYYLASYDADPGRLFSTAVPHTDISLAIQGIKCQVLVFIDTCHSGGLPAAHALNRSLQELYSERTGAIVFASSLPTEPSLEDPRWGHGAFTYALLGILADPVADSDGDGLLALSELNLQLASRVKRLTQDRQHPVYQKPPTIREDLPVARLVRTAAPGP